MCNQRTLWNSKSGQNCVTDNKECAVHTNTVLWWASAEMPCSKYGAVTLSSNVGICYDQNIETCSKHRNILIGVSRASNQQALIPLVIIYAQMQKVLNCRNVYVQDMVQKHCAQVLLNVKVLLEFKLLGTNGRSSLLLTLANAMDSSMEVMMEIRKYSRSRFVLAQGDNDVFALQHYVSSSEHDVSAF